MRTRMHPQCPEMIWQLTKEVVGTQYIFVNFWNQLNVYSMLICNHSQTCIKGWFSVLKFLNIVIFIFFKQLCSPFA